MEGNNSMVMVDSKEEKAAIVDGKIKRLNKQLSEFDLDNYYFSDSDRQLVKQITNQQEFWEKLEASKLMLSRNKVNHFIKQCCPYCHSAMLMLSYLYICDRQCIQTHQANLISNRQDLVCWVLAGIFCAPIYLIDTIIYGSCLVYDCCYKICLHKNLCICACCLREADQTRQKIIALYQKYAQEIQIYDRPH